MSHPVKSPKKLIEVALPLDAINVAAAREKSIRHGHPSRCTSGGRGGRWRPLGPSSLRQTGQRPRGSVAVSEPWPGVEPASEGALDEGRKRLFKIIEDLVIWENTTNEDVLKPARDEIRKVVAGDVRTEQGPPAGDGALQPGEDARPARPVRRWRDDPARSPAAWAGGLSPAT